MQGIFVNGRRPKSKKEVREVVAAMSAYVPPKIGSVGAMLESNRGGRRPHVTIESTSMFGDEYGG